MFMKCPYDVICTQGILRNTLKCCTLAATSGWNEHLLLTTYYQGLEPALQLHLSANDDTIEILIQLSIWVANCVNYVSIWRIVCAKNIPSSHSSHSITALQNQSTSLCKLIMIASLQPSGIVG